MSKKCLGLSVVLAFGFATPANGQPAKPAAETALTAVPTDSFWFVSIKVSKLWDNPAAGSLRDWFAKQKTGPLDEYFGVSPADIDRATFFSPSWDFAAGGVPIILVATRKPFNEEAVLKALGVVKPAPQPFINPNTRAFELNGGFRTVVFVDDRTLLLLQKSADEKRFVPNLLAQLIARKADGPLAGALAIAANHDFIAAIDVRGAEEFATLIQLGTDKRVAPFMPLLKAKSGMITADFDKTAKIRGTLAFADAESAKQNVKALEGAIKYVESMRRADTAVRPEGFEKHAEAWLLDMLKNGKVAVEGANLVATADVPFRDELAKLVAALPKSFAESKNENTAINNLKQLAIGLHSMHDVHRALPGDVGAGLNTPPWSWRVQILPYIEQDNLYKVLDHNLPWDHPNNLKLLEKMEMPKTFECPGRPAPKGQTYFRIFSMPKNAKGTDRPFFKEGERGPKFEDIRDGLSNTFMIVEAGEAVPWYKPDVLAYDGKLPLPQLGAKDADRFVVCFGDGSVKTLTPSKLGEKTLRALISIQGGEVVVLPK